MPAVPQAFPTKRDASHLSVSARAARVLTCMPNGVVVMRWCVTRVDVVLVLQCQSVRHDIFGVLSPCLCAAVDAIAGVGAVVIVAAIDVLLLMLMLMLLDLLMMLMLMLMLLFVLFVLMLMLLDLLLLLLVLLVLLLLLLFVLLLSNKTG